MREASMRSKVPVSGLAGIFLAVVFFAVMGSLVLSGRLAEPDTGRPPAVELRKLVKGGLVPARGH